MNKEEKKEYNRKWREEHPNYHKEYDRQNRDKITKNRIEKEELNPTSKEKRLNGLKTYKEKWKKQNKGKYKAQNKANNNLKIPKGKLCEDCNKRLAVHKHHEDYNKPLEIKFLCVKCHSLRHRGD